MLIDPLIDLAFSPLKFSRNQLAHTIPPADMELVSRVGLRYLLTTFIRSGSGEAEELHTSEGREKPPYMHDSSQIFEGATFRYNSGRNGKIDGLLSYQKPEKDQDRIVVITSQTVNFWFEEEVLGGEPPVSTITNLADKAFWAIKAGLNNEDFYSWGNNYFSLYQAQERKFLTWQPNDKVIGPEQEEYLSFLVNFFGVSGDICLRGCAVYTDSSRSDTLTIMSVEQPPQYSILSFPVGLKAIKGAFDPAKTIKYYSVWLSDSKNGRISEVRNFHVDRSFRQQDRFVLFVNSLGGWDTIRFTGEGNKRLTTSQQVAYLDRPVDADPEFSELKIMSISGENELTMSTGFFSSNVLEQLRYLDELLLSDEIYLVGEKFHQPLQLTTSNNVSQADNTDLIARTFSFRILDSVTNYSVLPAGNTTEERPSIWKAGAMRYLVDERGFRTGYKVPNLLIKYYNDNSLVIPVRTKPNVPSDPDYISAMLDPTVSPGSTLYYSQEQTGTVLLAKNDCAAGYYGTQESFSIPAGAYGGETQAEANTRALAELTQKQNSQAFANEIGSCLINQATIRFVNKVRVSGEMVIGTSNYQAKISIRATRGDSEPGSVTIPLTGGGATADVVISDVIGVNAGGTNVLVEWKSTYASAPYHDTLLIFKRLSDGRMWDIRTTAPSDWWGPYHIFVKPGDTIEITASTYTV